MVVSQPRWCQWRVMEELSNRGSSSKWRLSMATARAPPFSPVPQICAQNSNHQPTAVAGDKSRMQIKPPGRSALLMCLNRLLQGLAVGAQLQPM